MFVDMLFKFIIIGVCFIFVNGADDLSKTNTSSINKEENDTYYPTENWSDTFDWQLLKAFPSSQYRNVLISPISLKLVLALLYEGSGGITEREFQNVLQFPSQKQLVSEHFNKILQILQDNEAKEYVLNIGTRIFLDSAFQPQQKYAARALDIYRTKIISTNFTNNENASRIINSWTKKLTNGRIPEIIKSNDLQDAIMVITNAIYFKGTWVHKFPKNETKTGGFYVSPNQVVNVQYMCTVNKFYFVESNDLDAKILRLPYRGNRYSLFIVLPNSKGGLTNLIKNINLHNLKQQFYSMEPKSIAVSIPKLKFKFQARYTKILQDFGLHQMFQNTASFPGIVRGHANILRLLVVSDIIQKSGIVLDEEGSTVYAASEVQVGNRFGDADYVFNATHPFLFFIEEQVRGTVLFVGKVENPLEMDAIPLASRLGEDEKPAPVSSPQQAPVVQGRRANIKLTSGVIHVRN